MDLKIDGERQSFDLKEQTTAWLLNTNRELQAAAKARGLQLPGIAGATALEGAQANDDTYAGPAATEMEILGQIPHAHHAFNEVVGILNQEVEEASRIPEIDEETFATELDHWLTDERLAVIEAIKARSPDAVITLVAAPNIGVSSDDLIRMHTQFGDTTGHSTILWKHIKDLYGRYSGGRELTSSRGYGPINFSIDIFSDRLSIQDNNIVLQDVLQETPSPEDSDLELIIPSPLDAEVYRRALLARGEKLDERYARKTFIPHYNLPAQLMPVSWSQKANVVPLSLLKPDGTLSVGWSQVNSPDEDVRYFLK